MGLQAATTGFAVALLGLMAWGWMWFDWNPGTESMIGFIPGFLGAAATAFSHILGALWLVLRHLDGWILIGPLALLTIAWVATLGLGTTCWRLAAGNP